MSDTIESRFAAALAEAEPAEAFDPESEVTTMPAPLDYSQQSRRRSPFRPTPRKVIVLCVLLFAAAVFHRGGFLTSADIRLDTGDLRYRYLGIPLVYKRMPEPQRSRLLALAANSKVLRPEWCKCATFPLRSSNNEDAMCRGWYYRADIWAAQDPQLARLMLEDVASYIASTNATIGVPASADLLSVVFVEPDATGQWVVKQGWRQDDELLAYTKAKGYNLPTTAPSGSQVQQPQVERTSSKQAAYDHFGLRERMFIAGFSPCVVIQPFEFVQKHFFVIYGLVLAWVVVVAVVSVLSRWRKGKPIFRPKFTHALFSDQWCSGRSFKSLLGRFGGAKRCLWVAVADGELWVGLHFPFNLAFPPERLGLEYRLRGSDILSVEQQPMASGGGTVLIRFHNAAGTEEAFEITVRNVEDFNRAIDEIRNRYLAT